MAPSPFLARDSDQAMPVTFVKRGSGRWRVDTFEDDWPYGRRLYRSLVTVKPLLGVAATGLVAVLLWKILLAFLFPFIGIAAGFLFLLVKLVMVTVMVCVAIWLLRRWGRGRRASADAISS